MPYLLSLLVSALLIVVPTVIRYNLTEANETVQVACALTYLLGLGIYTYTYWSLLFEKDLPEAVHSKWFLALLLLIFWGMPPVLSHDLYVYLLQGQLALQNIFTYVSPENNLLHEFVAYVDEPWKELPNHYGPLPTFCFALIAKLGGEHLLSNILLLKGFTLAIALALIYGWEKVIASFPSLPPARALCFVVLNPVFLIQGLGQMHLDLLTCAFIIGFIYALHRHQYVWVGIFIASVGAIKSLLLFLFLGIGILFWGNNWLQQKARWAELFTMFGLAIFLFALYYIPVWEGWDTLIKPLVFHENKEPVKSLTELLSYVWAAGQDSAPDGVSIVAYNEALLEQKVQNAKRIALFFKVLALLLAIPRALAALNAENDRQFLWEAGKLMLLVFILYSPIMHAWYFLLVLPFWAFGMDQKEVLHYAALVFALACTYEVAYLIDLQSPLRNVIMIAGTILSVLAYYLYFPRFFTLGQVSHDWQGLMHKWSQK